MMPSPPLTAIVDAITSPVTVSIGLEIIGSVRVRLLSKSLSKTISERLSMSEYLGTRRTSSYVSAVFITLALQVGF